MNFFIYFHFHFFSRAETIRIVRYINDSVFVERSTILCEKKIPSEIEPLSRHSGAKSVSFGIIIIIIIIIKIVLTRGAEVGVKREQNTFITN